MFLKVVLTLVKNFFNLHGNNGSNIEAAMENSTYIALSRLDAQQRAMSVVANNIANANTSGFKAQRTLFNDYLSQQSGAKPSPGGKPHAYTQDRATYLDQKEGTITPTGNTLDLAISGEGFFTVSTAQGTRLTRAGQFSIGPGGTIVDPSGNQLLDGGGTPIQVSPSDVHISVAGDGTISSENGQLGRIAIVKPDTASDLKPIGGALYSTSGATTQIVQPKVTQGAIEGSNVQTMIELTMMIQTQREFQFTAQFVDNEAQRQQTAIDKIGQMLTF